MKPASKPATLSKRNRVMDRFRKRDADRPRRTPFDGSLWEFLNAITDQPIVVKLAQSPSDWDGR